MTRDPLIGQQLGNFEIERLVGRGGMALVYYGWDVKLERPVAIKVIDVRYRDDPAYVERFVREARAVATWRHENIVQIYYADEQDGLYYFAMEYIEGLDLGGLLSQYAAEGELMPHDDVLRMGRAIASALDYAHQKGVIHRDVKPANVMMTGDGRVVLTDFGLAMDVHRGSLGQVFDSSRYIAPEQARSSADAVPQSDLYALGVILYEMLTGVVPFGDPSPTSVAVQHLTQPPPPPREVNPNLDQETEVVLLKALGKSPEERYQTGTELIDALEGALRMPAGIQASAARLLSRISVDEKVSLHLQASEEPAPPRDVPQQRGDGLLGRQLDEYRLDALLGQGGMARVYRGWDVRLKRYVAIKVIDAPFRADSDYVMRFEREAQAIAQLEHPHIVRVYRYGEAEDQLYIAMQYVEGTDLGSVLASYREDGEFIEPEDAARIVREVCLALDYAHSQGIIHRDVKSANIVLDKEGRAVLTDFGLALLTALGTRGEIFGSPHYIAPEQAISSANVVSQSDLYAVGVILYEMFTGELPFDAEDPLDVAMLHMTEPPRPPRESRAEVSPELEAVILKALAKEPAERYQSGAELADALDRALEIVPVKVPSPPVGTVAHLPPPERAVVERAKQPPAPIPAAVATPVVQPAGERTAPSAAFPKSKRLILYMLFGIGACTFLAVLSAVVLFLASGGTKNMLERLSATETPPSTPAVGRIVTYTIEPALTPSRKLPATVFPTIASIPSPTSTSSAVSTHTATPASTPAPTSTAMSTGTPGPTETFMATSTPAETFTPTATPTPEPLVYNLLVVKRGGDGLFVVNQAQAAFPLEPLRLGDGEFAVSGEDWDTQMLESNECVAVWKKKGNPRLPKELKCDLLDEDVPRRDREERFWEKTFDVYYNGRLTGTCEKENEECSIGIPVY